MINGRTKGHEFERNMAIEFRDRLYYRNARRQLEYQIDDCKGVDLKETGKFRVQCKRGKKYANINAIQEIEAEPDTIPLLITKADWEPVMVALTFDDFCALIGGAPGGLKESPLWVWEKGMPFLA